jgi:flagellar biosynthesis protein FlhA
VVQAIVITKGTTRIAKAAARFYLDILPEKQKAIEAEYSSGSITEEDARRRKDLLQKESGFYSNMDGATAFISGNVKAGIFITAVNLFGGIFTGTRFHGEALNEAVRTYISFSIGDGVLFLLPTLLVSISAGIIVRHSITPSFYDKPVAVS